MDREAELRIFLPGLYVAVGVSLNTGRQPQTKTSTDRTRRAEGHVLRLAPGVQAHTHSHIQAGRGKYEVRLLDPLRSRPGEAVERVPGPRRGLGLVGLHAHIGSQIYEPESLAESAERIVEVCAHYMRAEAGFELAS